MECELVDEEKGLKDDNVDVNDCLRWFVEEFVDKWA